MPDPSISVTDVSVRLGGRSERLDAYEEISIPSGSARIVLSIWRGAPREPVVVFLPGTMTHPLFYEPFLAGVSNDGVNVVGVHPHGHGLSPRTRTPLTFGSLVRNAEDAVRFAERRFGTPVVVMGSSQGGVVAMAAAATGLPLAGVVAHNILDPTLPSSIEITRFPASLRSLYRPLIGAMRAGAAVAPRLRIPIGFYLDLDRVCREAWTKEAFLTDPIGLRSYPLGFLASLFSADLSGIRDGRIRCPVVVLAARGDTLFPYDYTLEVFERIEAPSKRLVTLDLDHHLIFNECIDAVLPVTMDAVRELTSPGRTAGREA